MVLILYKHHLCYVILLKDSAAPVSFGLRNQWNHIGFQGNPQECIKFPSHTGWENQCSFYVPMFL